MRATATAAVAAAVLLGCLSAAPAVKASTSKPVPAHRAVALEPNYRTSRVAWMVKASRFNIDEGPAVWATSMHWPRWNSRTPTGTGTLWAADEHAQRLGHVTIHLNTPRGSVKADGRKHPYFTRLHIIGGHDIVHYWHWSWSAKCWQ